MTSKASTYGQLCGCVCLCTECTLTRCFILYTAQIHKELNVSIFRYVLRIFVSWANVFIAKRNCFMNSITVSCVYGCCSMNRGRIFFSFFSIFRFAIFITHTKHIAQSDNNNDDHFQDRERETKAAKDTWGNDDEKKEDAKIWIIIFMKAIVSVTHKCDLGHCVRKIRNDKWRQFECNSTKRSCTWYLVARTDCSALNLFTSLLWMQNMLRVNFLPVTSYPKHLWFTFG